MCCLGNRDISFKKKKKKKMFYEEEGGKSGRNIPGENNYYLTKPHVSEGEIQRVWLGKLHNKLKVGLIFLEPLA